MVASTSSTVFHQAAELAHRFYRRPEVTLLLTVFVAAVILRGILWLYDGRADEKVLLSAKQYLIARGMTGSSPKYILHRIMPCARTSATGVAFKIYTDREGWSGQVCWDGDGWRLAHVAVIK